MTDKSNFDPDCDSKRSSEHCITFFTHRLISHSRDKQGGFSLAKWFQSYFVLTARSYKQTSKHDLWHHETVQRATQRWHIKKEEVNELDLKWERVRCVKTTQCYRAWQLWQLESHQQLISNFSSSSYLSTAYLLPISDELEVIKQLNYHIRSMDILARPGQPNQGDTDKN